MRNLKKLVALIVTIVMMATLAVPAFAAAPADVVGTDYEAAVTRLVALGIITGRPDGTYGPNDSITRAEFAAVIIRALGHEDVAKTAAATAKFSDVPSTHWAAGYIGLAVSLKIVKGYTDGRFGPNDKVTYDQAVAMIIRAIGAGDKAELEGGYPLGYMLLAKKHNITTDVPGAAGKEAPRGIVALLVNNALSVTHYVKTDDSVWAQPENNQYSFLKALGMDVHVEGVIVTKTPASAGLDANKFVAGGVTYKAVEGAIDIESLLGKKVDLWGEDKDHIVLAEKVVGTTVAIKKVDDVTVSDGVYSIDTTLEDGTDKVYKVVAGAGAFKNLEVASVVDTANALKAANAKTDLTKINFVVDDDKVQFVDAVIFGSSATKLTSDPIENKVSKFIRLFAGFYIKYDDKDAKKVVIEKDGELVDWSALKKGDILFIAGSGDTTTNDNYVYVKATSKTVTGKLESVKDAVATANEFKVAGTWYKLSQTDADGKIDVTGKLGKEVKLTLDPAGKVFEIESAEATVSTDKYGVVLGSEIAPATTLQDAVYKVKLATASGDEIIYTVKYNDDTEAYADTFGAAGLVGDLVSYHINSDGLIDKIANNETPDNGVAATFDTDRRLFKGFEIADDAVIFAKDGSKYEVITTSDIKDDQENQTTAISYVADDGVISAIILSAYPAVITDATYAYVTDYVATKDGYTVTVLTKDGIKEFNTEDADAANRGNVVKYQLDGDNNMINVTVETIDATGVITAVDASKARVDVNDDGTFDATGWFKDSSLVIYDVDSNGTGAEALVKADLYADMEVEVYLDGTAANNVVAIIVTAM